MASDLTQVLNTIAKYNYNTFIHTHKKIKFHNNSTCKQMSQMITIDLKVKRLNILYNLNINKKQYGFIYTGAAN